MKPLEDFNTARNVEIAKSCINRLNLNLEGLSILTECASGPYAFTPIMASMAGAEVMALGRDSRYGTYADNRAIIQDVCRSYGLKDNIEFFENDLPSDKWALANITTNSGMLRPLNEEKIGKLNCNSMISLMWETWELRDGEIDIASCQKRGIPVVGTNEHYEKADLFCYPGMLCLKMLFEMGLEVGNNSFVLLGEGLTGRLIARDFRNLGIDFDWFVDSTKKYAKEGPCIHYSEINQILQRDRIDAVICADHLSQSPVFGEKGYMDFKILLESFPLVQWAHLTGPVDPKELEESGIRYFPKGIRPHGYMSYTTENLGWEPVIMLNSAGLKVGELVANARKKGFTIEDSIQASVDYGIGQDFDGGFMNFKLAAQNK